MESEKRDQSLDFLRGIAIFAVVIFHVSLFFGPQHSFYRTLASQGFLGVQLFFIVSAITMCRMWDLRRGESSPMAKFYIRRVCRIAGPFWLALILYGLYLKPDIFQLITTTLFIHALWPHTINAAIPGGWSIGVEMLFYLCFPVLVKLDLSPRCYAGAGLAVYIANIIFVRPAYGIAYPDQDIHEFLYLQFWNQAPVFLIGMSLSKQLKNGITDIWSAAVVIIWIALSFVCKFVFGLFGSPFFWIEVFLLTAFAYTVLQTKSSFEPINYLGRMSYSIYLVHLAIVWTIMAYLGPENASTHWAFWFAFPVVFLVSTLISILLGRLVEKPSSEVGRAIISRLDHSPPLSKSFAGES